MFEILVILRIVWGFFLCVCRVNSIELGGALLIKSKHATPIRQGNVFKAQDCN